MKTKDELFQDIDGERPSPEQAALLMSMAEGDTSNFMLDSGEPDTAASTGDDSTATDDANTDDQQAGAATAGTEQGKPKAAAPADAELNADNAVVLAKDGKHTIPFEKLAQSREGERHWREKATELQALLDQAQQRADSGQASTEQQQQELADAAEAAGVDLSLFGDFSEEGLAKGINALVEQKANALVDAKLKEALAPLQQREQQSAREAHYGGIYAAHPDADSIYESKELDDWIKSHPAYLQPAVRGVFTDGSQQDVIDLFTRFKEATGKAQQAPASAAQDAKSGAQAALQKAKNEPPVSLSDIPDSKPSATNLFEQLAQLNPTDLSARLETLPKDQVEAFLNRSM